MINGEDFLRTEGRLSELTRETQVALLDFFMVAADTLDADWADPNTLDRLREYYSKAIADEQHPLHQLYSDLCDENTL